MIHLGDFEPMIERLLRLRSVANEITAGKNSENEKNA
jgi:hypothetical protein